MQQIIYILEAREIAEKIPEHIVTVVHLLVIIFRMHEKGTAIEIKFDFAIKMRSEPVLVH